MVDTTLYKDALELMNGAHFVLILTHINPDADTISSGLALSNFLFEKKIKHRVFNKMKEIPSNLDYLPRFEKITDQMAEYYGLLIFVDCGDKDRATVSLREGVKMIYIDLHGSNNHFGDIAIVDSTKASTAEVLFGFFEANRVPISKNVALCLYAGLYDDSLRFSTPRVDSGSFSMAHALVERGVDPAFVADMLTRRESLAKFRLMPRILESLELHCEGRIGTIFIKSEWLLETGASYRDGEDVINMVLSMAIVDIAILFRHSNGKMRVSLRSKNGIDVATIADHFGGGGHTMAAGCSLDVATIDDAKAELVTYIYNRLYKG